MAATLMKDARQGLQSSLGKALKAPGFIALTLPSM
jgi:hypothetical protein